MVVGGWCGGKASGRRVQNTMQIFTSRRDSSNWRITTSRHAAMDRHGGRQVAMWPPTKKKVKADSSQLAHAWIFARWFLSRWLCSGLKSIRRSAALHRVHDLGASLARSLGRCAGCAGRSGARIDGASLARGARRARVVVACLFARVVCRLRKPWWRQLSLARSNRSRPWLHVLSLP